MKEREQLIKELEKAKQALSDTYYNINIINDELGNFRDATIDELPMELQDGIMALMHQRNVLWYQKLEMERLVQKAELLLEIGEQYL